MLGITHSVKRIATAVAAGALTVGLLGGISGAAHASEVAGVSFKPLSNPLLFVDVSGAATGDGAPVIQWVQSGNNQLWYFEPVNGHMEIINQHSDKCLTTDGVAGHPLYQWRCKAAAGQLWDIDTFLNSWVPGVIKNPASGLVMDVSDASITAGAAILAWYPNGGTNQLFSETQ
jgi:hypothetical protein